MIDGPLRGSDPPHASRGKGACEGSFGMTPSHPGDDAQATARSPLAARAPWSARHVNHPRADCVVLHLAGDKAQRDPFGWFR